MDLQQILQEVGNESRYKGEELVPGTNFGVKYTSAKRKLPTTSNDGEDQEEPLFTQCQNEVSTEAPAVSSATESLGISGPPATEDGSEPGVQHFSIKTFKNRLEIPGLLHPDDWMAKHTRKSKKKRNRPDKEVRQKADDPRDLVSLVRTKQRLMYGENPQPAAQYLGQTQQQSSFQTFLPQSVSCTLPNQSDMPLLAGGYVPGQELFPNRSINCLSTVAPIQHPIGVFTPFAIPYSHHLSQGIGLCGPSMYPPFQTATTGVGLCSVGQAQMDQHHRHGENNMYLMDSSLAGNFPPIRAHNDANGSINGNQFNFQSAGATSFDIDSSKINSEDYGSIDFPHNPYVEQLHALDNGLEFTANNDVDDCMAIHEDSKVPNGQLSCFGNQSGPENYSTQFVDNSLVTMRENLLKRSEKPLSCITECCNGQINYRKEREECHDIDCDIQNKRSNSKMEFLMGSVSPILGSSLHSKRKCLSRKSSRHNRKEQKASVSFSDPIFDLEDCGPKFKPRYASTPNKFRSKTPSRKRPKWKKISFLDEDIDDDLNLKDFNSRRENATAKRHRDEDSNITLGQPSRCLSPDLFASQDPLDNNQRGTSTGNMRNSDQHGMQYGMGCDYSQRMHSNHYQYTPDDSMFEGNNNTLRREESFCQDSDLKCPAQNKTGSGIENENTNTNTNNNSDNFKSQNRLPEQITPPSELLFSPKVSLKRTEDSFRSDKGVIRVSTVEGEMFINPQHWRLAHKFTDLLGRKGDFASRDLFGRPRDDDLGRPRKVTSTEELLQLYTSSSPP